MAAYKIYHKDGSVLKDSNGKEIAVHSIEYNGTWMGECFVTVTFENEAPIDFSIGDYIVYRNERFEINYDPGKIKCSSKDSYGGAFKYDNVKFNALSDELVRCDMLDLVLYDNNLHYTALPQFSFYVESLDDLLDRIQANLDELYGTASWKIYSRNRERSLQRGCLGSEWDSVYGEGTSDNTIDSTSISISDQTCWDALSLVNSQFDINFIIRNRNVYVGTAGVPTTNVFKYGKGKGLYEIEQNSESDQMIVTRLRAYGSNRNLPNRYYADLGSIPFLNITGDYHESSTENGLSVMMEDSVYVGMFTDIVYNNGSNIKHCRIRGRIDGYEFGGKLELVKQDAVKSTTRLLVEEKASSDAVKAKIDSGMVQVDFLSGANKTKFDGNRLNYVSNLPNNMACDRLMLPGFPNKTLKEWWDMQSEAKKAWLNPSGKNHIFSGEKYRPFVDSLNTGKIGVRPSSVFFDKDDKVNGIVEIYPTIEGMEVEGVRVDEIYKGSNITDDGRFGDNVKSIPNFDIYLSPKINFDVSGLMQEDFTICMKDGMCAGREFKVAGCVKQEDNSWKLTVERALDNSLNLYFPYKDFQIKEGDHFVLTGIELPDAYVDAASEKLLKYCIAYLDKNDYTRYVYQPKVDEIFMARQHDTATADTSGLTRSLYLTLKEGDIMLFKDEDLGIDAEITIDQLTIKEEDGKIPTYEITLREEKEVGTIQKIQNQISSIVSGNGGTGTTGGGITTTQIKNLIDSVGSDRFLSKLNPDTAQGLITFLQGLVSNGAITANGEIFANEGLSVGDFVASLFDGRGAGIDKNGNAEVESLRVRSYMQVMELIINRIRSMDGDLVLTEGDNIESVEEVTDAEGHVSYKLHLKQQWEGYYTAQAVGNVLKGVINTLAQGSGTYYTSWMLVKDVNTATNTITVDLYPDDETPAGQNFPPCEMMNIVRWGNNIDPKRQSCIYLSSTEGVIKKLIYVTKPILDEGNDGFIIGKLPEWLTKDPSVPVDEGDDAVYVKTLLYQNIHQIDYQGKRQPVYVDRGNWVENPAEPYHFEAVNSVTGVYETSDVWYYGCKWRCIKDCPTDAPKWNSMQWMQIEGNPDFDIEIAVENGGLLDFDYFSAHGTTLEVTGKIYNLDVTKDILDADVTWTRKSKDAQGNDRTESDKAWNALNKTGKNLSLTIDDINYDSAGIPSFLCFTARALLRDGVTAEQSVTII